MNELENAARTKEGKVILYSVESGRKYERAEDCALDMIRSGQFSVSDPATPLPLPVVEAPIEAEVKAQVKASRRK